MQARSSKDVWKRQQGLTCHRISIKNGKSSLSHRDEDGSVTLHLRVTEEWTVLGSTFAIDRSLNGVS